MKTVLFVEDDGILGEAAKFNLESSGYFVIWHQAASGAIHDIEGGLKYDILVVDASMEGDVYDGVDVAEASKKAYPKTPVVGYSAYREKMRGADAFVKKSETDEPLFSVIKTLLKE